MNPRESANPIPKSAIDNQQSLINVQSPIDNSLSSLAELPFHIAGRYPKPLLVGRVHDGGVVGESTKEWFERLREVALALEALDIRAGDRIAIVSESRPEWLLVDLAILTLGAVTVPVYPTLGARQVCSILQDATPRLVFVSGAEQVAKLQAVRHEIPSVEAIVAFDPVPDPPPSTLQFDELVRRGHARIVAEWGIARQFHDRAKTVRPEQLATIIYTSGTTGEPKGVMLSHRNLVSNLIASHSIVPVESEDTALSYLPLSHAFERLVSYVCLWQGVTIVYAESMETVGRDLSLVRPTVMTGVPRVFEKFQARILDGGRALPMPRRALFQWGVNVAMAKGRAEAQGRRASGVLALEAALAERLVFGKIRERVGGRLRLLVSGSAPLPASVAQFFHGIGLPITEGYGLTETAPVLTANPTGAMRLGTVGTPIPGVEIKIADDGEILARGPNVMMGYYNKPDATAEVLRDGWFHTGDVGTIGPDGYLTITDRKKDLIVTSGGKKIAPQPIEAMLRRNPLVAEAVVLGDRRKFASALIVPDFAVLERRLHDLGRGSAERTALVQRPDVVALYQEIVDALNQDLSPFERIKKIRLLPREFTIASGEMTPTMKVKRRVVEENWKTEIDSLY
jgi:long-chain acyl-CoA synthetase